MSETPKPELHANSYLDWMKMQNSSPRSLEHWEFVIRRFNNWCAERELTCVTEVTKDILEAYRRHLFHYRNDNTEKPITFRTQLNYLQVVVRWFRWLHEQEFINTDPTKQFKLPKQERRLPTNYLTADEVETVLNSLDVNTDLGIRNRAIVETFYSTGIRCSELTSLDVYDLELDRGVIKILAGKGGKDRVVPVGERAILWLRKYLADVRPTLAERTNTSALFLTYRGRPIIPGTMSMLVRKMLTEAGITKPGSCHLFRHSVATLMLENGADLRSLQMFLGHERLTTTQIYTHVSIQRLQEVHRQTHPVQLLPKANKS